jgi:hypothetical protein
MRRILLRSLTVAALVAVAATSGGGSRPAHAGGHDPGLPANCRLHGEAVFWTQGSQTPSGVWDWTLLGQEFGREGV